MARQRGYTSVGGAKTKYLTGGDNLRYLLSQLPTEMKQPIRDVIQEGAKSITNAARRRAPRDSGDLKRAINYMVDLDGLGATIGFGKDAYYGRFIELGSEKRDATPFLWPAFAAGRKRVYARLTRRLRALLKTLAQ